LHGAECTAQAPEWLEGASLHLNYIELLAGLLGGRPSRRRLAQMLQAQGGLAGLIDAVSRGQVEVDGRRLPLRRLCLARELLRRALAAVLE